MLPVNASDHQLRLGGVHRFHHGHNAEIEADILGILTTGMPETMTSHPGMTTGASEIKIGAPKTTTGVPGSTIDV